MVKILRKKASTNLQNNIFCLKNWIFGQIRDWLCEIPAT